MKIGLIVNPVAGLGGMSADKGSDDLSVQLKAMEAGYERQAISKAKTALEKISELSDSFQMLTISGEMGADASIAAGIQPVVYSIAKETTTAEDTCDGVKWLLDNGIDVLAFAGGDGTAKDILSVAGDRVPVVGIPAGVKIHSSVYAVSAAAAGYVLHSFIQGKAGKTEMREVMDVDESSFRRGIVSASLFGYLPVVVDRMYIQNAKQSSFSGAMELDAMADCAVLDMEDGVYYLIGPGSTTEAIKRQLGIDSTLLGVDVVKDRKLVLKDADERQIFALVDAPANKAAILVTFIGGQGHIFGRGNQQLSPRVIRKVGKENIRVMATKSKLAALKLAPLLTDTGDSALDAYLSGYYKICVSRKESLLYRVKGHIS